MATHTYESLVAMGATEFRRPDGTITQVAECPAWEHAPKIMSVLKFLIKIKAIRGQNVSFYAWEDFYGRFNPK